MKLDLVFTREDRSPVLPHSTTKAFGRISAGAGLPSLKLDGLRHSWATTALRAGIPAKVVQDRLGHASIATTIDTYTSAAPELDQAAAEKVAALILG